MPFGRICSHQGGVICTACRGPCKLAERERHRKQASHGRNTRAWQLLRAAALARAGGRCELRLDDRCTGTATSVHLDSRLNGNHSAATLDDLKAACAHCHGKLDGPRATRGR